MVEQRNSYGGTLETKWGNSGRMMVEQWNRIVDHCKNYGGKEEQLWWNSEKVMVEQWNSGPMMVDQWNRDGGTEKQL